MNSNQKNTISKQGSQSGKDNSQSDPASTRNATGAGKQGGTHQQHVEAGRQSHKNSGDQSATDAGNSGTGGGNRQSDSGGSGSGTSGKQSSSRSGDTQGGTREQHVEAGRQSHKNTK